MHISHQTTESSEIYPKIETKFSTLSCISVKARTIDGAKSASIYFYFTKSPISPFSPKSRKINHWISDKYNRKFFCVFTKILWNHVGSPSALLPEWLFLSMKIIITNRIPFSILALRTNFHITMYRSSYISLFQKGKKPSMHVTLKLQIHFRIELKYYLYLLIE